MDIRLPIGMMFTVIGLMLGGYGLFTGNEAGFYTCSLEININLIWGIALLAFGGGMWLWSIKDPAL